MTCWFQPIELLPMLLSVLTVTYFYTTAKQHIDNEHTSADGILLLTNIVIMMLQVCCKH